MWDSSRLLAGRLATLVAGSGSLTLLNLRERAWSNLALPLNISTGEIQLVDTQIEPIRLVSRAQVWSQDPELWFDLYNPN